MRCSRKSRPAKRYASLVIVHPELTLLGSLNNFITAKSLSAEVEALVIVQGRTMFINFLLENANHHLLGVPLGR